MTKFNLQEVWNETIEKRDRPLVPRNYVYASEIGGSLIDRYLKMKGIAFTNPPNSRSMRKFMAGDIWEWIVQTVLVRAGIKFRTQERISLEYEGLLRVSGKIDFILTGDTDFENIKIDENMPEFMQKLTQAIVGNFKGREFIENIIEIKSVGSFVFEDISNKDNPKTHHMYQAGCYRLATKISADVIYVCRDDVRILQYNIDPITDEIENEIKEDLKKITYHYNNDIEPEKEKLVLFENGKFKKNWKVEYSSYLSMLYSRKKNPEDTKETPFEKPDDYYDWASSIVAGLNRVAKRIQEKKEMTKSNEEWIDKGKELGFDLLTLIKN